MNLGARLLLAGVASAGLLIETRSARGAELPPSFEEVGAFVRQIMPTQVAAASVTDNSDPAQFSVSPRGFLNYVSAPPGHHLPPLPGAAGQSPSLAARDFLMGNRRFFGLSSPQVDFIEKRPSRIVRQSHYVRLQQVYDSIPIIAGEATVQLNQQHGVETVLCDIESNYEALDDGRISTLPAISSDLAAELARAHLVARAGPVQAETGPAGLAIFAPSVLDEPGEPHLVWDLEVFAGEPRLLHYRVLVSALDGDIVRAWTLSPTALNREILDKANSTNDTAAIVRSEGQPPIDDLQVDNAYDYLGDTYGFFFDRHGRDSFDGAGAQLIATVRYCDTNNPCPWPNANAGLVFGDGYATDDIVAHEFTHKVTAYESGLIYTNASGAINESFSDVWGDFVDQLNLRGDDALSNRWVIAEDRPEGGFRNMRVPPAFDHPDRLNSPLYQAPANTNDNGGVHRNSGVNNKLCYLLSDGDNFNGQTIRGLGILRVADLYYEVNVNLLTAGANWSDLYNALRRAAVNLGWTMEDRLNLYRACVAVEIAGPGDVFYVDSSSPCNTPVGVRTCSPPNGPFLSVAQGVANAGPGDILYIRAGHYNEPVIINRPLTLNAYDGPATIGTP
jgi:Zn-dependent metalloprotease